MSPVFVGIGSNVGDRIGRLRQAVEAMASLPDTAVVATSPVYTTEPVGLKEQPDFLNAVAELDTRLSSRELVIAFKEIEVRLGRTSGHRWGPREIDLDLLYYGNEAVADPGVEVPHPEVAHRRFVLVPLQELAAEFIDPVRRRSIADLLRLCPDTSAVRSTDLTLPFQVHHIK